MGRIEPPVILLQRPHGSTIGPLGYYFGLNMQLKFSETSELSFQYPEFANGRLTPMYDKLTPAKLLRIDPYGIFIINKVVENQEGARHVVEVTAYSREYEFAAKQVIFKEGTYNFWNPADVENTVMGMLLKCIRNWKIGSVSPALIGKYRVFPDTDAKALDFMLNTLQSTYGCVFVFDTYNRIINVIDADDDVAMVPVYLSHYNLVKNAKVSTSADNIITQLAVHGADDVSIRNVNPTGNSYIYNLDYFISNGDIPDDIAAKWRDWQNEIFVNQAEYTALVALRNSANSRLVVEKAALTDLQTELAKLENIRAVCLQSQMVTSDEKTYQYYEDRLANIAEEYVVVQDEISAQESVIEQVQAEYDEHLAKIVEINTHLNLSSYFSDEELNILDPYFNEDSYTDETFAVFDVDVSDNATFATSDNFTIQFGPAMEDTSIIQDFVWVDVPCDGGHTMAAMSGGTVSITGTDYSLSANLVRGIWDHIDGKVICSLYLGAGEVNGESFNSGSLSCVFESSYDDTILLDSMVKNEDTMTSADGSVSHTTYYYTGTAAVIGETANFYFTRNASDYQQYTVEQELYNHASAVLENAASPTYEFEIESGNFIFEKNFMPFRDAIQLGCGVYLQLNDRMLLKPMLLEIHLDYENRDNFSLVFSNTFKRSDNIASYQDLVKKTSSMSRTLQTNQYEFGENKNTTTWVKNLLQAGYDAALAQIMAGENQNVTINSAGLKADSLDGKTAICINNGMIALYDKETNTVTMGLGHFYNKATGADFVGVVADIIGGTLLAGQNLIIECPDPNGGVMQFKVDSSGVIINNGRMYMNSTKGAMGWDANYGFFAGNNNLFETTDTGYVIPTCIDSASGALIFDDDGFPQGVNVWVGIDGKVYIRGNIYAENGVFNGEVNANKGVFKEIDISDSDIRASRFYGGASTNYVEMNGTSGNYAFWAGDEDATKAPFSVTRGGSLYAHDGDMGGWTLIKGRLYSGSGTTYVALDSGASGTSGSSYAIWAGGTTASNAPFSVTRDGKLYASAATIQGTVTATAGTIGGCTISNNVLQIKNANIAEKLTADQIDATNLTVSGANVSGTLTAATISASKITAGTNDAAITFNGAFTAPKATITGTITANYLTANSGGQIAGWAIDDNSISYGTLGTANSMWLCRNGTNSYADINGSGAINGWCIGVGPNFGVTKAGNLYANNVNLNGTIASSTIKSSKFTGDYGSAWMTMTEIADSTGSTSSFDLYSNTYGSGNSAMLRFQCDATTNSTDYIMTMYVFGLPVLSCKKNKSSGVVYAYPMQFWSFNDSEAVTGLISKSTTVSDLNKRVTAIEEHLGI